MGYLLVSEIATIGRSPDNAKIRIYEYPRPFSTMNASLLTLDIIQSHASACRTLHEHITVLQSEGYDLLVVPSRGAHPFLTGANSYLHKLRAEQNEEFSFPRINYIEELYIPFTADVAADFGWTSASIRNYWSRMLAAIIRRDHCDVAYRLHRHLKQLAGELGTGTLDIKGGLSGKFIFVDTVQSGQAISEIAAAFDRYGLNECHFILLLDEHGNSLKGHYRALIERLTAEQKATVIPVSNIFTEDEGPAMSGIWAVTFPDLMLAATKIMPEFAETKDVAAGLYYHEVRKRADSSNLAFTLSNAKLSVLLHSAVRDADAVTAHFLDDFKDHIVKERLQNQNVTRAVSYPIISRNFPVLSTDVSGSHVVRATMAPEKAEAIISAFCKLQ